MFNGLESERLILRSLSEDDASFIYQLVNTEGWLQFIGNRNVQNVDDAGNYIQKILANPKFNNSVFIKKSDDSKIGIVSFLYRENYRYPDIGYALLPEFEKNGYAFEAVSCCLELIKAKKITDKIIAITKADNAKSIRLLERLGLIPEYPFSENGEDLVLFSKLL